jgi:hypothetical protein
MTTIAVLRRRTDNLARRWWRTGGDHVRAGASSRDQCKPATATFNDSLDRQPELLPSAGRVINRLQRLCGPALTLSPSVKSP